MKSAGLHLLFFVVAGTLAAQSTEPAPPAKTSPRLTQAIRSALPKFVPRPPTDAKPGTTESTPPDPNLLVLPTVTVQENRQPRIESDDFLTPQGLNKKFARDYKNSLEGLDAALNGFSIPFVSPSLAARGRTAYKARKLGELNHAIETVKQADLKASIELKKEVLEMLKVQDWNNRVTGGK